MRRPANRSGFEIAIICALPLEADAVYGLFDEHYDDLSRIYGKQPGDANTYSTGRIGGHNIVLAHMPGMGKGSAASVASSLRISYVGIKLALLVGICGGAPFPSENIQIILGDVIISNSVVEYDFGRQYPDGFQRKSDSKDTLGRPNRDIRTFLSGLETRRMRGKLQNEISHHLDHLQSTLGSEWKHPGAAQDRLFEASYRHKHYQQIPNIKCICPNCRSSEDHVCDEALRTDCYKLGCDGKLVQRDRLNMGNPRPLIHIGTIASADTVMKSGEHRDRLTGKERIIGFEMEGAGVWDNLPCVIIKGVCDYADSHKNKRWQGYAAATAASCAKAFLEYWPSTTQEIKVPVLWSVPFQRNEKFVGRASQLNQLEDGLFVHGRFSKMALFALGGMGKTSIALEVAYRAKELLPTYSVFWVTSTTTETFEQSYRDIGKMLALPGIEDKNTDIKKLVKDHLSESSGHWLMIFDNADDHDIWFERSESLPSTRLADYVPGSSRGCALLTTRNRQVAIKFASQAVVEVVEMDMETAQHFLRNTLIRGDILDHYETTKQLLAQLCFLPLAVVQVAAYMNMVDISILEYLSLLNETEESLVQTLSEDFEDKRRYPDQKNPVASTWVVSFERIRQHNPLAAEYLSYMSCVEPKAIPQSFIPPAPSTKEQLEALSCLTSYSFISKREDESFDMHRLVHIATRHWLKNKQTFDTYHQAVISRLATLFPSTEHRYRRIWRAYLPHVKFALALNCEQHEDHEILLSKYGSCLLEDGKYDEAELPLTQAADVQKQTLGIENPHTLGTMGTLARLYSRQRRLKEAEELYTSVIMTQMRVLGLQHPPALFCMGNLAGVYQQQGRLKEAEELCMPVIETLKRVLGQEHPQTLFLMGTMAQVYQDQGRLKEAEELCEEVSRLGKCQEQKTRGSTNGIMNNSDEEADFVMERV